MSNWGSWTFTCPSCCLPATTCGTSTEDSMCSREQEAPLAAAPCFAFGELSRRVWNVNLQNQHISQITCTIQWSKSKQPFCDNFSSFDATAIHMNLLVMSQTMFNGCSFEARNRVFQFDSNRWTCLSPFDVQKNNVQVCSMSNSVLVVDFPLWVLFFEAKICTVFELDHQKIDKFMPVQCSKYISCFSLINVH